MAYVRSQTESRGPPGDFARTVHARLVGGKEGGGGCHTETWGQQEQRTDRVNQDTALGADKATRLKPEPH